MRQPTSMLGVDLLLLVLGGALVVGAAAFVGGKFERRAELRRRRLQGQRNAEQEKLRLEERCAECGEPVDPNQDVWDLGQWWHRTCYRDIVR
jgi:hypothetical protein